MVKPQDTFHQRKTEAIRVVPLTDIINVFTVTRRVGSISTRPKAEVIGRHERGPLVCLLGRPRKGVGEDQSTLRISKTGPGCILSAHVRRAKE